MYEYKTEDSVFVNGCKLILCTVKKKERKRVTNRHRTHPIIRYQLSEMIAHVLWVPNFGIVLIKGGGVLQREVQ